MLYAILFASVAISIWEYRRMYRKKYFKDIVVHAAFLCVGIVLLVLQLLNIQVPSPTLAIQALFGPAGKLLANLLS
ncbi:hypothetical protein D3C76_747670 [compost metagenome]|nr:hypothetical protein [Paenibacillus timonensis]MUG85219.1 hypothetical protein [Paenibacillus timonensis]